MSDWMKEAARFSDIDKEMEKKFADPLVSVSQKCGHCDGTTITKPEECRYCDGTGSGQYAKEKANYEL